MQAWQLMDQPVTLQEFEDLPLLRSTFFHYNLGLEGNAASVLDCNDAGEVKVGAAQSFTRNLFYKGQMEF